jgi:GT2 family glycosyltransferase
MKVTIVAAYNTQVEMTKAFLNTLDATTKTFRQQGNDVYMILVNGGCEVKIEHPFINERIDLPVNEGFASTVNEGLKRIPTDTDYIIYMGNDSFPVDNTWIQELFRIQGITDAGIVCPANDRPGMDAYKHLYTKDCGEYWECEFFPSIVYFMTKECFDTVGLWDPLFARSGMYGDNDYCMRVRQAGYKIVVCKHVMLRHLLSQEAPRLFPIGEDMVINGERFNTKWS